MWEPQRTEIAALHQMTQQHQGQGYSPPEALAGLLSKIDTLSRKVFGQSQGTSPHKQPEIPGNNERSSRQLIEEHSAVDEKVLNEEVEEELSWPTRLTSQPTSIEGGTMREYQLEGLNWMISLHDQGVCGILADEMGLGKTLETISLLAYLKQYRKISGPHLVIVPKSTLGNWLREFGKWCPSLRAFGFLGDKDERKAMKEVVLGNSKDVIVTTYEMAVIEISTFRKVQWSYIIIDEAHRIKNEASRLSLAVREMHSSHRLLITGTPLQNNLQELWALLNYLVPELFDASEDFTDWFRFSSEKEEDAKAVLSHLHRLLRPFLLRRLKKDVEDSLLPKIEMTLYVGLSPLQKQWYRKLLSRDIDLVNGASGQRTRLLNMLMHLRKVCNHPYLFEGAEPGPPYVEGEHLVQASGKLVLLDKLLVKLKAQGSRVLVFSQMTRALDILDDYCALRGFEKCRIDGSTSQEDRETQMDAFNAPNSSKFLFLLSTRAGGLGINLQTADVVILYDSDWNPQMDLQACDRAHRIGQKKQVRVFRLVTEGTIEEKIVERAYSKLFLDALVIQQGSSFAKGTGKVSSGDMLSMIRFGADEIFRSEDSEVTDQDIDAILAQGEERTREMNANIEARLHDMDLSQLSFDGSYEQAKVYEFEGKTFGRPTQTYSTSFVDMGKRKRKESYDINGYYKEKFNLPKPKERSRYPTFRPLSAHAYQFFTDAERMHELEEKEYTALVNGLKLEAGETDLEVVPLTKAESKELSKLKSSGFAEWNKKDFYAFIRANERFGRSSPKMFAAVEGKSIDQVKAYSACFWKRYKEIPGSERYIASIAKNEARRKRFAEFERVLDRKVANYEDAYRDLRIPYTKVAGKYSRLEDRFLFVKIQELGYGNWEELQAAVRESYVFRFDWFLKTRSAQELARRVDQLIRLVASEAPTKGKKRKASSGSKKGN